MESTSGFIELRVISCKSLKAFNFFQKLSVYALVYIASDDDKKVDRKQLQRTPTDRDGDGNPEWNHTIRFDVCEYLLRDCDKVFVHFDLRHEGAMFGDKFIGEVVVPFVDLIQESNNGVVRFVTYEVRTRDGKSNGELNFSFKVNIGKDQGLKMEFPASPITGYPLFHHHHSPEPEAQFSSSEVESESPKVHYPVLDLEDMLVQGPQLHSSSSGNQDLNLIQESNYFLPQNGYYQLPPPPPPLPYPPPPAAMAHGRPYCYHLPPPPGSNMWGPIPYVGVNACCAHGGSQLGSASTGWQGVGGNYPSSSGNGSPIKALEFATQMGFKMIVLKGDAVQVVNSLRSTEDDFSNRGPMIEEGRSLIAGFDTRKVQHTRRQGNSVAHPLAKHRFSFANDMYWVNEYPSLIHESVMVDAISFD